MQNRTTMTAALLIALPALLLGYLWGQHQPQAQAQDVVGGPTRYVLFQAEYALGTADGQNKTAKGLFKLETDSGRVWRYAEFVRQDGQVQFNWFPTYK